VTRLVLSGQFHPSALALIAARPEIEVIQLAGDDVPGLTAALADADALMIRTARVTSEAVRAARRLKVISRNGVGYDNVPVEVLSECRVPLAITGDVNSKTVAEHTLALMLALLRRLPEQDQAVRAFDWGSRENGASEELCDKRVLLVGFGRIGREVARRVAAFDARVLIFDPALADDAVLPEGAERVESLEAGLQVADVVSLHVPLSAATRGLVDAGVLGRMKPGAYLVNTSRGGLIDETALAAALRSGRLAGAALDTFDLEPFGADSPLNGVPGTLLSPHSAALTRECARRLSMMCAHNALTGLDGTLDPALVVNAEILGRTDARLAAMGGA
jgi:D-3-phosphoglycerate dehydrogenase